MSNANNTSIIAYSCMCSTGRHTHLQEGVCIGIGQVVLQPSKPRAAKHMESWWRHMDFDSIVTDHCAGMQCQAGIAYVMPYPMPYIQTCACMSLAQSIKKQTSQVPHLL
jgi:uncharacterized protein (DUF2062 family)